MSASQRVAAWRQWWRERHERRAKQEAMRQQLREEYRERLRTRDPDGLESARDYGDNDYLPWRQEVNLALVAVGMYVLFVVLIVLIAFFSWIKHLTGG